MVPEVSTFTVTNSLQTDCFTVVFFGKLMISQPQVLLKIYVSRGMLSVMSQAIFIKQKPMSQNVQKPILIL